MPNRDSMPVERSTVNAMVDAASPVGVAAMSISSYSQTPSWTTVRPPAETKRRAGAVGRPNSSVRPSAVSPRSTTANALSALRRPGRLGQGKMHPETVVATRVDERRGHADRRLVRPQLEDRLTTTFCSPTRAWESTSMWSGHRYRASITTRARTGPGSATRTVTSSGASTNESARGGRVVVRVAEVPTVDQLTVPWPPVEGERAQAPVHLDRHQAVGERHGRPGLTAARAHRPRPDGPGPPVRTAAIRNRAPRATRAAILRVGGWSRPKRITASGRASRRA